VKKLVNPLNRLGLSWPARRPALATSVFADSTMAHERWQHRLRSATRYARWGAVLGAIVGLVAFAPAAWLAQAVASATGERVMLADARGTVWNGSAVVVLAGGPGSRDASSLPGRMEWTLGLKGSALELRAQHACCLFGPTAIQLQPGFGRLTVTLPVAPAGLGQWPAAWLAGLGTPWNTLQLGGSMRLSSSGARIDVVQGRWRLDGQLTLDVTNVSSRISTLDELGSYRIVLGGHAAAGDTATLVVTTTGGALQVTGQGQWAGPTLRFRGEAVAAEGAEAALNNLLNIIGRRQGARSVISIG
jgi:general secretion pathway protein N